MQVVKKREKYRKGTVLSGLAYDKPGRVLNIAMIMKIKYLMRLNCKL